MATNLIHDHRVTEAREAVFSTFVASPTSGRALEDAVRDYKYERVRTARGPDFMDDSLNGVNILRGALGDVELASVVDVTGLHDHFRGSTDAAFATYPRGASRDAYDPEDTKRYLDARLRGPSGSAMDEFVSAVLGLMNRKAPHHPLWMMPWAVFEELSGLSGTRWCEAVGLPIDDSVAHWVIVLKLRLREAGGVLVRPTVLDGGWAPTHFPSPPQAHPQRGGFSMDLREVPPPDVLRAEFIVAQPVYHIGQWEAGTRLKGLAEPWPGSLEGQRTYHLDLLEREFGPEVRRWMSAPI